MQDQPAFLRSFGKRLLIGGRWVDAAAGETFDSIDPCTGRQLAGVARGRAEDIDRAVWAARTCFEDVWRHVKPGDRQRLLLRFADLVEANADELAALDTMDMGATIARSLASQRRWVGMVRYYAGLATALHGDTIPNSIPGDFLSYSVREPVGVVGGITPWNAPTTSTIWKAVPALAAGCTMVLKPSEEACLSALRLGELFLEAGLPEGAINIVPGFGDAGAALAAHDGVDKISFTGSTATGQKIIQASAGNVKRVTLELGGKSPDIVFADADLDAAVPGAAMAAFANSGQLCSAGTRLFVERAIYDEFLERLAGFARGLRLGNSMDPQTQIGPLVSQRQLDRVCGYLDLGRNEGARALIGGQRATVGALAQGCFVEPTVFGDVNDSMRIAREEIFGPVIAAIPFDGIDEVVRRGNDSVYGLGSGVWTRSLATAHRVAAGLRAGSVWVNCYQAMDPAIPFGGYKASGYGRESGREHMESFLQTKAVIINLG